jgi:hypothetical protein
MIVPTLGYFAKKDHTVGPITKSVNEFWFLTVLSCQKQKQHHQTSIINRKYNVMLISNIFIFPICKLFVKIVLQISFIEVSSSFLGHKLCPTEICKKCQFKLYYNPYDLCQLHLIHFKMTVPSCTWIDHLE